jgi:hypothetical protein
MGLNIDDTGINEVATRGAESTCRASSLPRRTTPKGNKTFVICTAPHQVGLPTSTSPAAPVAHLNNKLSRWC